MFQGPKQSISHYHETLGEALQGTELEYSGLQIDFKGNNSGSSLFEAVVFYNLASHGWPNSIIHFEAAIHNPSVAKMYRETKKNIFISQPTSPRPSSARCC